MQSVAAIYRVVSKIGGCIQNTRRRRSMLKDSVAVCCGVLQPHMQYIGRLCCTVLRCVTVFHFVWQCVAVIYGVCDSVLQYVAVCCSVWQCVAVIYGGCCNYI